MKIRLKISTILVRAYNALCTFRKIEKKVVFESFRGRQYSDNPRAISEKMHELYPDYQIVWGLINAKAHNMDIPDYIKVCEYSSMEYKKERATAIAYVRNEAMTEDLFKRKDQLYIQTWHGDRGIKSILYDAWKDGKRPTKVMDEKMTDLFVIGSDYAEERIKTAFRYTGQVLKTGCPRNDCLINPKDSKSIREKLGLSSEKKILLYAPTLRLGIDIVHVTINIDETLSHLCSRGGEWICLVRAHPKSMGVDIKTSSNIIDVSQYQDISELLMISDMLITDYSSCAGDFILRRKPVVLAQYDRDKYKRDFYMDICNSGYLIAHTQDELNNIIDTYSVEDYEKNCQTILSYFGTHETGHAAENVCRFIDEYYKKRKSNIRR